MDISAQEKKIVEELRRLKETYPAFEFCLAAFTPIKDRPGLNSLALSTDEHPGLPYSGAIALLVTVLDSKYCDCSLCQEDKDRAKQALEILAHGKMQVENAETGKFPMGKVH